MARAVARNQLLAEASLRESTGLCKYLRRDAQAHAGRSRRVRPKGRCASASLNEAFLRKPFRIAALLEAVRSVFERTPGSKRD